MSYNSELNDLTTTDNSTADLLQSVTVLLFFSSWDSSFTCFLVQVIPSPPQGSGIDKVFDVNGGCSDDLRKHPTFPIQASTGFCKAISLPSTGHQYQKECCVHDQRTMVYCSHSLINMCVSAFWGKKSMLTWIYKWFMLNSHMCLNSDSIDACIYI